MELIGVIGDVMLDRYRYCVNRDNPESSAPCYTVKRTENKLGGAGNVAANLVTLGSSTKLISVVGDDEAGNTLRASCKDISLDALLISDIKRPTILKERIVSVGDGRYHSRFDVEETSAIEETHASEILRAAKECSIIVVSDYNKGVVTGELMCQLLSNGAPVIVDPKPAHKQFYRGAFMIKPNLKEVREMSGLTDEIEGAIRLRDELEANILLSRGDNGVSYFDKDSPIRYDFPVNSQKYFDATGAGDTLVATFAHFFTKGKSIKDCVFLANKAAGISVGHPGCYQVSEDEVLK